MDYNIDEKKIVRLTTIRHKLSTDDKWLLRGLVAIFNLQTVDEKASEHSHHHNGYGFNKIDSPMLTSYAQQYIRTKSLSVAQMD